MTRYRIAGRFGAAPRFVLARSAWAARIAAQALAAPRGTTGGTSA